MSRNLDTALSMMSGEEKGAFSYILDSAWALDDFLDTRNAQALSAVINAARDEKLGVPANYVDLLTQFASLEDLIHNGDFTNSLLGPYGICADRCGYGGCGPPPQARTPQFLREWALNTCFTPTIRIGGRSG